jgi:hypothetical protein
MLNREDAFVLKKMREYYAVYGYNDKDIKSILETGLDTRGVSANHGWTYLNEYSARQLFKHLKKERRKVKC